MEHERTTVPIRTRADVVAAARELYRETPLSVRLLQVLRPYICPFEELVNRVPAGSAVLDVGCGAGLLLGLLGRSGKIDHSIGFDISTKAIASASVMAAHHFPGGLIEFRHHSVCEPWPDGEFDVVCMIDVLHHVHRSAQRAVLVEALAHVRPDGLFIYKDMADRPHWQAGWNRLHDLALARQWIRYCPLGDVRAWLDSERFQIAEQARFDRAVYGHELIVAAKEDEG